jgi:hypothetical protein
VEQAGFDIGEGAKEYGDGAEEIVTEDEGVEENVEGEGAVDLLGEGDNAGQ